MKVVVIGAGLSGLATALKLHQAGIEVSILESRSAAGGRIVPASGVHQDLGPSWIWPYAQPVITRWLEQLGLTIFDQFDQGDSLIDRHPTETAVRQFIPSQHGMVRVVGGTHAIVNALLERIPDTVSYDTTVTGISIDQTGCTIEVSSDKDSKTVNASSVVVAVPPRLAAPLLPLQQGFDDVITSLNQTPTWMAQHCKVVAHFEHAFWRESNLSGRVMSQVGPLGEIHDHCGPEAKSAALFGFVGVPALQRKQAGVEALRDAIQQQLLRCFGSASPAPVRIDIKDWAQEQFTSTDADLSGPGSHPVVGPALLRDGYGNRLWFAGAEVSSVSPGLIEGALARADQVALQVIRSE